MKFQPSERNLRIYRKAVLEEVTTDQLAAEYGVTAPRISQIVHRVGQHWHKEKLTITELREKEKKLNADLAEPPGGG